MICKNCGIELQSGAAFCTNCGTRLETGSAAPPPEQAPQNYMPPQQHDRQPIYPPVPSFPIITKERKKNNAALIVGLISGGILLIVLAAIIGTAAGRMFG